MANARQQRVKRTAGVRPITHRPPPDGPADAEFLPGEALDAPPPGAETATESEPAPGELTTPAPPAAKPEKAAVTAEFADPFLWMANYSTDEWRFMHAYLYRTAPIIDKRGGDLNIQVFSNSFDQDTIVKTHGSGDYRVDVVVDRPEGGRRRLRQFYFSILNPDHPPRIPITDWVDDPRNDKWAWAKATIKDGVTGGMPPAGGTTANAPMSQEALLRFVFEQVEKNRPNIDKGDQANLATKIISMVEHNQQKMIDLADPTKQLQTLKLLIEAIMPQKAQGVDPMIQMLMEDRKAMREDNAELRKLIMDRPQQKGFFEQLIENKGAISEIQGIFGGGRGGGGKTDWGEVVINGASKIIEGLAPLGVALLTRGAPPAAGIPGVGAAAPWPPVQPGIRQQQPARTAVIEQQPQPAAAETATTAEEPAGEEETMQPGQNLTPQEQAMLMQHMAKYGTLIQQCIPFLVDQFRAGLTGYDFRDWFISRHGMNWWGSMKNDLGAEGLLAAAKYDPALWGALQPEVKARKFFFEMFTDQGDEDLPDSALPGDDDDDDIEDTPDEMESLTKEDHQ